MERKDRHEEEENARYTVAKYQLLIEHVQELSVISRRRMFALAAAEQSFQTASKVKMLEHSLSIVPNTACCGRSGPWLGGLRLRGLS